MQFSIKRDSLLKSLNFVQGVVEKKNTLGPWDQKIKWIVRVGAMR